MIAIFTTPKPFEGYANAIQRNAIKSWTLLKPAPQIILFGGQEKGSAEVSKEFGLQFAENVARNKYGTPLLPDMFEKAEKMARYDIMCYVNADVIVTQSLMDAVSIVFKKRARCVMICCTRDVIMKEDPQFLLSDWEKRLREMAEINGFPQSLGGVDVFVFRKGTYHDIPPFAAGRPAFDNWLIYYARSRMIPLIDTTPFVFTVHPDHENTSHYGPGTDTEETRSNRRLVGWWARSFIGEDATHRLQRDGTLKKKDIFELLKPRIKGIMVSFGVSLPGRVLGYILRRLSKLFVRITK